MDFGRKSELKRENDHQKQREKIESGRDDIKDRKLRRILFFSEHLIEKTGGQKSDTGKKKGDAAHGFRSVIFDAFGFEQDNENQSAEEKQ